MDKEWMSKNILSREYEEGVKSFLKFSLENARDPNQIPCPCLKCGNLYKHNIVTIKAHLEWHGIDLTYNTWKFHGETNGPANIGNKNKMDETVQDDNHLEAGDAMDMVRDAYETYQENPTKFTKLLEEAEKPLYPGSREFTKLSAIVKLYNLKAKYGWSDNSFTDLLSILEEMLPECNELPTSLYDAKKCLCTLGMTYEKIHACPNDCILYRNLYKDFDTCPICGLSRWKVGRTNKLNVGVPGKVLWYFPPIPRFLRMFRNREVAQELTWHRDKRNCDGYLRHPADAPAWRLVDNKWLEFASESRNLRLALSADGINPHSTMSSTYSCWPVILVTYNLSPKLCMKRKFMMLTLLISGPKQPGNDIDVYLSPLIDDLKKLWDTGVEAYDAYRQECFMLKAVLLWTINDFPAYGNLSGCSVKGYLACPVCGENTYAKRLKHGKKMSYTGHRRFLPRHHPYRRQKKHFDGLQEFASAPKPLFGHEVFQKVKNLSCSWGKQKVKKSSKEDDKKSCWKKKSIFFDLEYWEHLHVRHILDVMHIEKNVCESLIGTLLNIPGKTKDGIAARLDMIGMGVRNELAPEVGEKRTFLPPACYTLSKEEKKKLCSSLSKMKVPIGYSSNIANLVSMKDLKLIGMKSHDYHILMQQLLPVAIRGVLPKHVRYTISRLCSFFNVLCNKIIDVSKLDEIQSDIVITLCLLEKYFPPSLKNEHNLDIVYLLEKYFPPSFFDIMVHLVVHLVREVKLCGPVWYRWMYPFERFMKILKGYVRNRNRPEGCIAECYVAEEAVEFCADYLSNVNTIGIPMNNHQVHQTKPLSSFQLKTISDEEWHQAHLHVLTNDIDIDPYSEEHKRHLKTSYPALARLQKRLQDEHNKLFISWLRERLSTTTSTTSVESTTQVSEKLKRLANGPSKTVFAYQSYMINGVVFHTKERDERRVVQNSGVCLVANTMQVASAKDKNPILEDMVFYGTINEIWELNYDTFRVVVFKCDWVDGTGGMRIDEDFGFTLVNLRRIGYKDDSFILGSQATQVFYVEDPQDRMWSIVLSCPNKEYVDEADLGDIALHQHCFTKGIPTMNINEDIESNESFVREDCDGTWVDNTKT